MFSSRFFPQAKVDNKRQYDGIADFVPLPTSPGEILHSRANLDDDRPKRRSFGHHKPRRRSRGENEYSGAKPVPQKAVDHRGRSNQTSHPNERRPSKPAQLQAESYRCNARSPKLSRDKRASLSARKQNADSLKLQRDRSVQFGHERRQEAAKPKKALYPPPSARAAKSLVQDWLDKAAEARHQRHTDMSKQKSAKYGLFHKGTKSDYVSRADKQQTRRHSYQESGASGQGKAGESPEISPSSQPSLTSRHPRRISTPNSHDHHADLNRAPASGPTSRTKTPATPYAVLPSPERGQPKWLTLTGPLLDEFQSSMPALSRENLDNYFPAKWRELASLVDLSRLQTNREALQSPEDQTGLGATRRSGVSCPLWSTGEVLPTQQPARRAPQPSPHSSHQHRADHMHGLRENHISARQQPRSNHSTNTLGNMDSFGMRRVLHPVPTTANNHAGPTGFTSLMDADLPFVAPHHHYPPSNMHMHTQHVFTTHPLSLPTHHTMPSYEKTNANGHGFAPPQPNSHASAQQTLSFGSFPLNPAWLR